MKTKKELLKILKTIPFEDNNRRNAVVCSLIGHSRIQNAFWGQYTCARCGAFLGDTLSGYYLGAKDAVVVGHNCRICRRNYKKLTWKDKLFCKNPFTERNKKQSTPQGKEED